MVLDYFTFYELKSMCKHHSKQDYCGYFSKTELDHSFFHAYLRKYVRNFQKKPLILFLVYNITSPDNSESVKLVPTYFTSVYNPLLTLSMKNTLHPTLAPHYLFKSLGIGNSFVS